MIEFSEKKEVKNLTKFTKNSTQFILCDCGSEVLLLEYDNETKTTDLAIFETYSSFCNKMSLWTKFKYIYRVLFYGRPYSDQMILNIDQITSLKNFLEQLIKV